MTGHRVALVEPLDDGSWCVRQWEVTPDLAGEVVALLPGDAQGSLAADGLAVLGVLGRPLPEWCRACGYRTGRCRCLG